MWYRVFSRSPTAVSPVALTAHLHALGLPVEPHFRGDDLGWTSGEFRLPGPGTPVQFNRFLTAEDDIRGELNTFAAELEVMDFSPHCARLMQHVIQTQQLVVFRRPLDHPDESLLDGVCLDSAIFLATGTDSVIQADGRGWLTATGETLIDDY